MHIAAEEGHMKVMEALFDFEAKADTETIVRFIIYLLMIQVRVQLQLFSGLHFATSVFCRFSVIYLRTLCSWIIEVFEPLILHRH